VGITVASAVGFILATLARVEFSPLRRVVSRWASSLPVVGSWFAPKHSFYDTPPREIVDMSLNSALGVLETEQAESILARLTTMQSKTQMKLAIFLLSVFGTITGIDLVSKLINNSALLLANTDKNVDQLDDLLYHLLDLDVAGTHEEEKVLKAKEEKALEYLSENVTKCDKARLKEIETFIATTSDYVRLRKNSKLMVGSLTSRLSQLVDKLGSRRRAVENVLFRPVTAGAYFYSPPGYGKTTAILSEVVPRIAKMFGCSDEVYNLNVSKYALPIRNERFALWDEFGAVKEGRADATAAGPLLNNILSSAPVTLPGAEIHDKLQNANFSACFTMSNYDPCTVELGLKPVSRTAFIGRNRVFKVVDAQYDDTRDRTDQPHRKADFSHLEFFLQEGLKIQNHKLSSVLRKRSPSRKSPIWLPMTSCATSWSLNARRIVR